MTMSTSATQAAAAQLALAHTYDGITDCTNYTGGPWCDWSADRSADAAQYPQQYAAHLVAVLAAAGLLREDPAPAVPSPSYEAAVRAVLDLHEERAVERTGLPDWSVCAECSDPENGMSVIWPCPTRAAVTAAEVAP